jgi:hypothetical protein
MDIFRTISNSIADIFKKHKSADPVNKNDILDLIDNNLIALRLVVSTYEGNMTLFDSIRKDLFPDNGSNKDNSVLSTFYTRYLKNLNTTATRLESSHLLCSMYSAAKIILADHEVMRTNFDLLFKDGTDDGEITLEQMKLSHAAIFGFINLSSLLADWFCFFIGQFVGQSDDTPRVPAYRLKVVADSSDTVASFVSDVLQRGASRGIVSLVQDVRKTGDVSIYTESTTLDSYANINDYPGIMRLMNPFAHFQPILFLREAFSYIPRLQYKHNLAMREWIQAKLVVLQMDINRIDPQSPEYQHQQQILQRYSDELAKIDAKIAHYEQG